MILIERLSRTIFVGYIESGKNERKYHCVLCRELPIADGAEFPEVETVLDVKAKSIYDLGLGLFLFEATKISIDNDLASFEILEENKAEFERTRDGKVQYAIERILIELAGAETMHPHWPKEALHACAIVAEEAGELLRDGVSYDETGDQSLLNDMEDEAIQTGAMAIRFLINAGTSRNRTIPRASISDILKEDDLSDEEKLQMISEVLADT
jgi:hypothetical protein